MQIDKHHLIGLVAGDVINMVGLAGKVPMLLICCRDCQELYGEPLVQIGVRRSLWNTHCDECEEIQSDAVR